MLPEDANVDFARAVAYSEAGAYEAAQALYLQLLTLDPSNRAVLGNLGHLLRLMGKRTAARTVLQQGLALYPDDTFFHVNFAHLLREEGQLDRARIHYEIALTHDAFLLPAHQGLAYLLAEQGLSVDAAHHRDQGFSAIPLVSVPTQGTVDAIPIVLVLSAEGGNVVATPWIQNPQFQVTMVFAEYCQRLPKAIGHRLVLNGIGDADRAQEALIRATAMLQDENVPVLNPPGRIKQTGRLSISQRLGALADVLTPKMAALPLADLESPKVLGKALDDLGLSFPLLVRSPGFHGGRHFYKVSDPIELERIRPSLAGDQILIIQYLDTKSKDSLFYKYRMMTINHAIYPLHLAISDQWKVHYGSSCVRMDDPRQRAIHAQFLLQPERVLGAKAMRALSAVESELGLDYGGIDFTLDAFGNLVVFEANATMTVAAPSSEVLTPERREALAAIQRALSQMVIERAQPAVERLRANDHKT
jgi:tetratricopeptide (TPR) repeat protein